METNKTKIEKMVDEICALAPDLSNQKTGVRKIVEMFIKSKPDVTVDDAFIADLRTQIRGAVRARQVADARTSEGTMSGYMKILHSKLFYGGVVAALVLLVVLPMVGGDGTQPKSIGGGGGTLAIAPEVKDLERGAFGQLVMSETDALSLPQADGISLPGGTAPLANIPRGGVPAAQGSIEDTEIGLAMAPEGVTADGTEIDRDPSNTAISEPSQNIGGSVDGVMIYPIYPERKYPVYVYGGELPAIASEGYVYRKSSAGIDTSGITALLSQLDLGIINIGSFSGLGIQRLDLTSSGDPAYRIGVDLVGGEVSIYHSNALRGDIERSSGVSPSNIDKQEVIRTANAFLSTHGIDTSSYGAPVIDNIENVIYEAHTREPVVSSSDDALMPYPGPTPGPVYMVSVRYPLMLDGKRVVEAGGQSVGITVAVDPSKYIVEGVYGLMSQVYDRSLYDLIQDEPMIRDMLKGGSYSGVMYMRGEEDAEGQSQVIEVEVEDPEFVLMKYWNYSDASGRAESLLVPALYFDVDQAAYRSQGVYARDAIVIPLAADFIKQPTDRPVPMTRPVTPEPIIEDEAVDRAPESQPVDHEEEEGPKPETPDGVQVEPMPGQTYPDRQTNSEPEPHPTDPMDPNSDGTIDDGEELR